MKKKYEILKTKKAGIIILLLFISIANINLYANIVYPWRASSAIAKCGESFEVWFNADDGQRVNAVTLHAQHNTIKASFETKFAKWIYDSTSGNTYNTKIVVKLPKNCPAERYDIVLHTTNGKVISPAALKVIKNYKSSYYILHLSDLHAFQHGYETTLSRLSLVADIANIINPEMVFNTGDNLYRPNEERMQALYYGDKSKGLKGLNDFSAATFTIAGNHDIDFDNLPEEGFYKEKADWWNKWWGLHSFQFKYGNARFMAFNNGWHGFKPTQQMEEIDAWLKKVGKGNLRVGIAHIRNKEMATFDNVANPGLILIGHNHHIANQNPTILNNKPIQYIANSMRDNMEFNLFKVDAKTGKYTPVGSSTAQIIYVENPEDSNSPALYKPKLRLSYQNANVGTNTTNTATIVNKFNFPIDGAKVRFIMPLGYKYKVSNGTIEQAFDGEKVHVVDVLINVEANSKNTISIFKK